MYPRAVRAADRCGAGIPASPELRTDEVRLAPIAVSRLEVLRLEVRQPEVLRREVSAALQVVRLRAVEEVQQLVPMEQARQMAQPQEAARSAQQGAGSMLEELQEPAPLKKPVALSFAVQPLAAVQEAVEVLLQEAVVLPAARPSARPEAVPSVAASACRPGLAQQVVRLARAQRVRCEIAQSSTSRKKPKGQWWQEGPSEALSCQPAVRRESFNSVQRSERFGESISMYRWGRNVADVNAATRFILE